MSFGYLLSYRFVLFCSTFKPSSQGWVPYKTLQSQACGVTLRKPAYSCVHKRFRRRPCPVLSHSFATSSWVHATCLLFYELLFCFNFAALFIFLVAFLLFSTPLFSRPQQKVMIKAMLPSPHCVAPTRYLGSFVSGCWWMFGQCWDTRAERKKETVREREPHNKIDK